APGQDRSAPFAERGIMTVEKTRSLDELRTAVNRARAAYDNQTAVSLYSEMLEVMGESGDSAGIHEVLAQRAICYRTMGKFEAARTDLESMAQLAEESGDPRRQIDVVARQVTL